VGLVVAAVAAEVTLEVVSEVGGEREKNLKRRRLIFLSSRSKRHSELLARTDSGMF
jgi:hypothetical protein